MTLPCNSRRLENGCFNPLTADPNSPHDVESSASSYDWKILQDPANRSSVAILTTNGSAPVRGRVGAAGKAQLKQVVSRSAFRLELMCPLVGTGARFQPDQARRQLRGHPMHQKLQVL